MNMFNVQLLGTVIYFFAVLDAMKDKHKPGNWICPTIDKAKPSCCAAPMNKFTLAGELWIGYCPPQLKRSRVVDAAHSISVYAFISS
ncbi:hypothetical protein Pst134EB_025076 [Puccinia striiformis f. sp. tritici]|nr:hypothetical protein Pst134EB_025076 [Puccinia striiformis f. sp. tritici]